MLISNLMKFILVFSLLLISSLSSQDTLFTVTGAVNIGKYLDNINGSIIFQISNSKLSQRVPHKVVNKVVLENGDVVFDLRRDNKKLASTILIDDGDGSRKKLIGNKISEIYHSGGSPHLPIEKNREIFNNKSDAEKAGYRICAACFDTRLALSDYNLEKQISKESNANFRFRNEIIYEYENQNFINTILKKVLDNWPETLKGYDYRILVVRDSEINATAIAGGNIYLTTGLLDVIENPKELEFVIAHEVAHIEKRHSVKAVKEMQKAVAAAAIVVTAASALSNNSSNNDIASIASIISAYAITLSTLGHSRELEEEADIYAQIYMKQNGDDLSNALTILGKISTFAKIRNYSTTNHAFASHPRISNRIQQLFDSELFLLEKPISIDVFQKVKKDEKHLIKIISDYIYISKSSSRSGAVNVTLIGEIKNLSEENDYEIKNLKLIHPKFLNTVTDALSFKNINGMVVKKNQTLGFAGTIEIRDKKREIIVQNFLNDQFDVESSVNKVVLNKGEELKKNLFQFINTNSSFQR